MTKHILIDGDIIVYRCGFAAEKTHYMVQFDNDGSISYCENYKDAKALMGEKDVLWSRKEIEPLENCLQMVKTLLEQNIFKIPETETFTVALSGKRNFREDIYPEYKANRASAPKPKYYMDIREYLCRNYGAVVTNGIEADDEIGIRANALMKEKKGYVVASTDKDLKQVPGDHYDFVKGESWTVSAKDSVTMFYQQLLSGDSTDNIPGITGIGPAKARKRLEGCQSPKKMAETVYKAYQEFTGIPQPDSVIDLNARLLWIFRKRGDTHPFWRHLGRENV